MALQDLQTNPKIAALLPYFVYVVSGVSWGGGRWGEGWGGLWGACGGLGSCWVSLGHWVPIEVLLGFFGVTGVSLGSIGVLLGHWGLIGSLGPH